MASGPAPNSIAADIAACRDLLYRYALLHVRDTAVAEDLVQATLLSALQAAGEFRGEAALSTWLVGILKRKIVDHHRARSREGELPAFPDDDPEYLDRCFQDDGHWAEPPRAWADPDGAFEAEAFWQVFEACVQAVPGLAGRVFLLREVIGLEPGDVCKDLGLSQSNYWVLMHRARLRLRDCLDKRWFKGR